MSNNAKRYSKVIGTEYDLNNHSELVVQAREEERYKNNDAPMIGRYVSAEGLALLAEEGVAAFVEATGHYLPHNLVRTEMSGSVGSVGAYGRRLSHEEADQEIESHARMGGWLKSAPELPAVRRMIEKTQSSRGINSPYTTIDLWDFVKKNPSPGRLERQLWKVKRRAQQILSAWEGDHHPSWASIANALCVTKSIGKAAVIVAAEALDAGTYEYRGHGKYSASRDFLVSIRSARFPVADNSDGVNARREEEPTLDKFGCQVYRIRLTDQYGRHSLQWLVTSNGRTYHSDWGGAREALQQALQAWKEQDKLQAMDAELVGFLNGDEGYSPLVYLQDSYDAGNCSAGTANWLRKHGWDGREFIPGHWLVAHLDYNLVRNVAMKVFWDQHEGQQVA